MTARLSLRRYFYLVLCLAIISSSAIFICKNLYKNNGIQVRSQTDRQFDLLINAYQDGGSRFTARFFGFRPDAFFFYEPLWRFSMLDYFATSNYVCSIVDNCCRIQTIDQTNRAKDNTTIPAPLVKYVKERSSIAEMMLDVLDDIYNCDFRRITNLVAEGVTDNIKFAGPSWMAYHDCVYEQQKPKEWCLRELETSCKSNSHVVTKVLRLTTPTIKPLMEKRRNLKLIQLFRNPFAVINGRKESSGWLPSNDFVKMGESLCAKYYEDYIGALRLREEYPDRVKIIFYDDLKSDLSGNVRKLYEYVGMTFSEELVNSLNVVKVNPGGKNDSYLQQLREQDNVRWWRQAIDLDLYQEMFNKCTYIVNKFKLTHFTSVRDLRNLDINEMQIPDHIRL